MCSVMTIDNDFTMNCCLYIRFNLKNVTMFLNQCCKVVVEQLFYTSDKDMFKSFIKIFYAHV